MNSDVYINYIENQTDKEPKEEKPKKKYHKLFITIIILDIMALLGLFTLYGPIDIFRNFWITSAMTTARHKYLARIFYSEDTIDRVMSENYVVGFEENSDTDAITFESKEPTKYASIYEEQILKRDEGNDLYKLIEINEHGSEGFLVAIYDPSLISLEISSKISVGGQRLTSFAKQKNAIVAINASGFLVNYDTKALTPIGTVIKDGKIKTRGAKSGYSNGGLIGFNKDHVLVLTNDDPEKAIKDGLVDAVEFAPFLIMNGKPATIKGNGGYGYAPRTAIGQRKDGIVLFLVFNGRNFGRNLGASMADLINIFTRYGAYNAANLDGGGSSTLVINNENINDPGGSTYDGERYLPNAWMVIK